MAGPATPSDGTAKRFSGFVPERVGIDAYGNGGFRFAGMSHRGSILVMPDGIHAWDVPVGGAVSDDALLAILARLEVPQFILLGTGRSQVFPSAPVRKAYIARGVGLEAMDTGAACRTFNVLLAEQRPVMAALVAVE